MADSTRVCVCLAVCTAPTQISAVDVFNANAAVACEGVGGSAPGGLSVAQSIGVAVAVVAAAAMVAAGVVMMRRRVADAVLGTDSGDLAVSLNADGRTENPVLSTTAAAPAGIGAAAAQKGVL